MPSSLRIEYLRWARAQANPPWASSNLILSGMSAPGPELLPLPEPEEMLGFVHEDHPALAHAVAPVLGLSPDRVLVQPGTHYSLRLMLEARLWDHPGPVVVEAPTYEPLRRIPEALGAEVLRLPRRRERGYRIVADDLQALAASRPSVLILSHPHNPTGAALSAEDVEALSVFAHDTGCAVLSDEVYLEFLENCEPQSLLHRIEGAVILRSFTKVFGLGGLRCTAIAGDRSWIDRAIELADHGPVVLPAPVHAMALQAWQRREALWDRARAASLRGRDIVREWLAGAEDLLESPVFDAGIICFPLVHEEVHDAASRRAGAGEIFGYGLDAVPKSSHRWIQDLRRRHDVQLTPGAFFETPRAFRLGYGGDETSLRRGLAHVEHYLRTALEEA